MVVLGGRVGVGLRRGVWVLVVWGVVGVMGVLVVLVVRGLWGCRVLRVGVWVAMVGLLVMGVMVGRVAMVG